VLLDGELMSDSWADDAEVLAALSITDHLMTFEGVIASVICDT
jgi:hypothetical protein